MVGCKSGPSRMRQRAADLRSPFCVLQVNSILPRKCGLPTSPEPGQKVEGGTGADGEAGAGTSIAGVPQL
jgi:hypothetical protein